jgi:hypothetical protein
MDRQTVIATLRAHENELRQLGVIHVALFGSRAREQHHADSDIDIVVDIDLTARVSLWDFVGISHFIGDLFPVAVDVHERQALKPRILARADQDAVHAF